MKPSQKYTIKVLSSEDFDLLPYPKAKESLGMSVMKTKTAFVRRTGVEDMDIGTIHHEFDELMAATSPHEENGIRYKAWIPFLINALAMAAGSAGVEALVTGGVSAARGGEFGEGAKQGAISGATGGAAAGLGVPAWVASAAGNAASAATAPRQQSFPGFSGQQQKSFTPSDTTSAFAPQTASPLSRSDFDTSLSKLSSNAKAQEADIFSRFRGQSTSENTSFKRNLDFAKTSS